MSEIYDEGLLPPNVHPSRTDRRVAGEDDAENREPQTQEPALDERVGDVADQGLLPPNVKPSRTDRTADADGGDAPPPEADTDDQLPGTDDGLHGQEPGAQAGDTLPVPAPEPEQVPERDPDIAPPTAPERAPAPEEDPEVAPLTDPEFDLAPDRDPDFRDPQRPEGTPI